MGFFGNKSERQAKTAAAQAESGRLRALPEPELAAEIMRAFGPNGINAKLGHRQGPTEVVSWLLPGAPVKYRQPILRPVMDALGVLEHANLLTRQSFGDGQASTYNATRRGQTALANGTLTEDLGIAAP